MLQKNFYSVLSALAIIGIISFVFYKMTPSFDASKSNPLSEFSTKRALVHVKNISKEPHYVNTENHQIVLDYLQKELQKLGLETYVQEEDVLTKFNVVTHTKNLITRIKGTDNSNALLLLSHYDSAPHSKSKGASDDGNGIAVILESVRAFLHSKTPHKNDIIIVFSDGEEVGLSGAYAFTKNHPWTDEIGLVINFEARGSAGPAVMLAETNAGNAAMITAFAEANPAYPISNSLMYSVYKMLPNDTDLTAFRETKNIQGFNFAYIDDHFDYHTAQDDFEHFSPESLMHQGTYLMPLLFHFSNADLSKLTSTSDVVYFNTPFGFIYYSYAWNLPLIILAVLLLIVIVLIGLGKRLLDFAEVIKGFVPFFATLLFAGFVVFLGWEFMLLVYPKYEDMLHGFTYNGHYYIIAFVLLTVTICFWMYAKLSKEKMTANHLVAPIFIWLVLCVVLFLTIEGSSYFIIPAYFSIFTLAYLTFSKNQYPLLPVVLAIPTLVIIVPFIYLFPIALGLKVLFGSALLTVFTFTLLLGVFGTYHHKKNWSIVFLLAAFFFFMKAHFYSDFEKGKGKPNSLVYVFDANQNTALWATYDKVLDDWTKKSLGEKPTRNKGKNKNVLQSKYKSTYTFTKKTSIKGVAAPSIVFTKDTIIGHIRCVSLIINPNRDVERIDVFAHEAMNIHHLKVNGVKKINQKGSLHLRKKNQLITFYPRNSETLELTFQVKKGTKLDMDVMTASFDLLENKMFKVSQRPEDFIPMPFVLNDAIIVHKKIKVQKVSAKNPVIAKDVIDSLTLKIDSLEIN